MDQVTWNKQLLLKWHRIKHKTNNGRCSSIKWATVGEGVQKQQLRFKSYKWSNSRWCSITSSVWKNRVSPSFSSVFVSIHVLMDLIWDRPGGSTGGVRVCLFVCFRGIPKSACNTRLKNCLTQQLMENCLTLGKKSPNSDSVKSCWKITWLVDGKSPKSGLLHFDHHLSWHFTTHTHARARAHTHTHTHTYICTHTHTHTHARARASLKIAYVGEKSPNSRIVHLKKKRLVS